MVFTATRIITSALHRLGELRFGQSTSSDILNGSLEVLNEMIDSWLLDELMIFAIAPALYPLTLSQTYTIGPTGDFVAQRPVKIEDANYVFSTGPLVRKPIAILSAHEWSLIAVQQIPGSLANVLWYEGNFTQPDGNGTIHLWPGPSPGNQLELFTWQLLQSFADLTTSYNFPPGYAEALKWGLAEKLIPMVRLKAGQSLLGELKEEAKRARSAIQGYNHRDLMTDIDPTFLLGQGASGAFNYLTGSFGSTL